MCDFIEIAIYCLSLITSIINLAPSENASRNRRSPIELATLRQSSLIMSSMAFSCSPRASRSFPLISMYPPQNFQFLRRVPAHLLDRVEIAIIEFIDKVIHLHPSSATHNTAGGRRKSRTILPAKGRIILDFPLSPKSSVLKPFTPEQSNYFCQTHSACWLDIHSTAPVPSFSGDLSITPKTRVRRLSGVAIF